MYTQKRLNLLSPVPILCNGEEQRLALLFAKIVKKPSLDGYPPDL